MIWWRALFGTCLCISSDKCKPARTSWLRRPPLFSRDPHRHPAPRNNNKKHPHTASSCPGLNPRGDTKRPSRLFRRLLFLFLLQSNVLPVTGVRVGSEPTALPGAQNGGLDNEVTFCAKPSGNPNFSGPYLGAVRKRAYKRACDRAAIRGGTYYRGTWHTARALQALRVQPAMNRREPQRREPARGRSASRVHVLSWNAGGLSLAMFDELILLLSTETYKHVSAVIIQETHWKHESTWRASGWNCVHSGCEKESHPGILIMIRETLVPHEFVRYDVIQPGRILHVRAPFGSAKLDRSLDLIGIYQYPWDARKPRQQLLEAREGVWKKLDNVLRRLPQRNLLFVCGDCNVQLPSQDKHVGTGIMLRASSTQQATDSSSLLNVLIAHDLCAVNTWRGPAKQAYTYSMGNARTLIDYIFVRASDADNHAKGCLPMTTFPIADWRLDGRHRVLVASLATQWKVRAGPKPKPAYDREAMQADYRRDPMLTEVSQALQALMQGRPSSAEEISACLLQACCQVYPASRAPQQEDRMHMVRGPIAAMWTTWRELRAVRGSTLRAIILTWRLRVRFKAQKRIVDRASRAQRKLRVHTLLEQAEIDDCRHNARGLYATVRKLAPKQRYKPLQVKTDKGVCLSSREEVAELRKFFSGVFCDTAQVVAGPCEVPFSPQLEAMTRALKQLPAHKAVPHTCAPSIVWKACADTLAPYLHSAFESMCCKSIPEVSHQWKDGWMVLAPKAGKPLCRACDVRPLALQDPGGKAAIRTVKEAIQPYVDAYMKSIPQYAYLQSRDGQMAILRACAHLRKVRRMVAGQTYTVHHHRDGHRRMTLCGGLTLSLDLRMAFDVLPRRLVERSLREACVPPGLISLIMAWLTDSSYHLSHAGESFTLTPTRGIRQGCVLSPLIWTCVTGTMVRDLTALGIAVDDLDLYADDYLHQEIITSFDEFAPALRKMGVVIMYLQDQGLQVSLEKTVVLGRVAGTRASMAMKQHTFKRKDKDGIERLYIKVPTRQTTLHLPMVQEHKYMGIMATYYNFEDSTLNHRISSAKNTYTRLKPFLRSRKRLSLPGRLRMWWACVWSSMRYALPSVGVTGAGATTLRGLVATHMRALAVSPRHLTGETTELLFARLGVRDPVCMIEILAQQQETRLQQCIGQGLGGNVVTQDMLQQAEWSRELWQQHATSDSRSHMRLQRLEQATEGWPCPHCGLYFISELAVTTHIGHQHAELHQKVKDAVGEMRPEDMGLNGMPTCRFCLKKHHSWQTLKRHIQQGRCKVLHDRVIDGTPIVVTDANDSNPAEPKPLAQQHELLQRLADQQLDAHMIANEVRAQTIQNCGIWGQWIADARQVKQHIRQSHTDIWNQNSSDIDALCATFGRSVTVPCGFCGTAKINSSNRPRHAKMCGVLFQTLLALRLAQQAGHVRPGDGFLPTPPPQRGGDACESGHGIGGGPSSKANNGGKAQHSSSQVAEKRGQRQGSGGTATTSGQTINAFFRPKHGGTGGGNHGATAGHSAPSNPLGGSTESRSSGQGISVASAHPGSGVHVRGDVQDQRDMEGGQGVGSTEGGNLSTSHPVQELHVGVSIPTTEDRARGGGSGVGGTGLALQAGGGIDVALSGMGHSSTEGHPASHAGTTNACNNTPGSADATRACVGSDAASLSCNPPSGSHVHGSIGMLHARGQSSGSACSKDVSGSVVLGAVCSPEAHGGQFGSRENQSQPAGHADQQNAGSVIAGLQLVNQSNYCYQHALLLPYMWATISAAGCASFPTDDASRALHGRLFPVLDFLMRGSCRVVLNRCLMWQSLLQQWRHPQNQHDIAEFMQYLMQKARPDSMRGSWHMMTAAGEVRDVGDFHGPMVVHLPASARAAAVQLQGMVDGWANAGEGMRRLIFEAPPLLCIQISRFHGNKRIRKLMHQVDLGNGRVQMPYRERPGAAESTCHYKVIALSVHLGNTPPSGHYRAVLIAEGSPEGISRTGDASNAGAGILYPGALYTDDCSSATPVLEGDVHAIMCNMYLLWCIKVE